MRTESSVTQISLGVSEWSARITAHENRVRPWVDGRIQRASRGEKHPVYDFLFNYYSYRPGLIMRWTPGIGVTLLGAEADRFLRYRGFGRMGGGVALNPTLLTSNIVETADWIAGLLSACRDRRPHFGCYGMHEWAMVYDAANIRHQEVPLRFPRSEIRKIVESQSICCSHYDAFRFFAPGARSLNRLQPKKETRIDFEQRGCLHTNMDLYKWAYKLAPWTPSELVADAFALAFDIRKTDMRASPYDLSSLGFEPIRVETGAGREEYECLQRGFSLRGDPIRERLIEVCRSLRNAGYAE